MTTSSTDRRRGSQPIDQHPSWCTEHTGFADGSDDWHQGAEWNIAGHCFFLSTGTISGDTEVFMDHKEGIPLEEAKELATRLLLLVEEALA